MPDIAAQLDAIRVAVESASAKPRPISPLDQFRKDFKTVYRFWREAGYLSADEARAERDACGKGVQRHTHDEGWMKCAMAHFRYLASLIEADQSRSARIRSEMKEQP